MGSDTRESSQTVHQRTCVVDGDVLGFPSSSSCDPSLMSKGPARVVRVPSARVVCPVVNDKFYVSTKKELI